MRTMIIKIGRPVHFKTKAERENWTACGVQSDFAAWDHRHVDCLRCRKTKKWLDRNKK